MIHVLQLYAGALAMIALFCTIAPASRLLAAILADQIPFGD
jgi:hypothetical protein